MNLSTGSVLDMAFEVSVSSNINNLPRKVNIINNYSPQAQ